jgi:predicted transcriptional regulator
VTSLFRACRIWGVWRSVHRNLMPQSLEDVDIVFNICSRRADQRSITVNQLVAGCVGSRNTVLRHLRALVDSGIVSIRDSVDDKRFKELALTKKGVRIARRVASSLRRLGAEMRRAT